MIGFLKNRSFKIAAERERAKATADKAALDAASGKADSPSEQAVVDTAGEQLNEAAAVPIETALASEAAPPPERYEIHEEADGWSVHDRDTGTTAVTYGYRLAKMNRSRAESLVAVLNRGEARRRGRNG